MATNRKTRRGSPTISIRRSAEVDLELPARRRLETHRRPRFGRQLPPQRRNRPQGGPQADRNPVLAQQFLSDHVRVAPMPPGPLGEPDLQPVQRLRPPWYAITRPATLGQVPAHRHVAAAELARDPPDTPAQRPHRLSPRVHAPRGNLALRTSHPKPSPFRGSSSSCRHQSRFSHRPTAAASPLRLGNSPAPGAWTGGGKGKSNEITAIPLLLERLALKGALVTIDAIGTQNKIAGTILERGADYLLALKANWPATFKDVEAFFESPPPEMLDTWETTDDQHGRIETRRWTPATNDVQKLAQDLSCENAASGNGADRLCRALAFVGVRA